MVREEEAGAFRPAKLLLGHADIFSALPSDKPVLDLACGEGQNGLFLAARGLKVFLADRSEEALLKVRKTAEDMGVSVEVRQVDFEKEGVNPLGHERYAGIIVFRYLHRPLIPHIKGAIIGGGLLMYETYTIDQRRFGRPRNPDFLLNPGELKGWFEDWHIIHYFEGIISDPWRAAAQIVCRKPSR